MSHPVSQGNKNKEMENDPNSAQASSQNPCMEVSQSHGTTELCPAENVIEVEVDFNQKIGKNGKFLPETGIPDVLDAEFALRNTNGGIIKLKMKTSLSPEDKIKKIDQWQLKLNDKRYERLRTLGQKEQIADVIDYRLEHLLIFVKKSSIILTEKSNLYVRRGTQTYKLQNYFEIHNLFVKNKPKCCCNNGPPMESFTQSQKMPFGEEAVTVEYKELTSKKLPDKLRKELSQYVAQFANTSGGYVYFGISDDGIIKGQHVNDNEIGAIKDKIKCCMNKSKIWIDKSGKRDKPQHGTHYKITFSKVDGADDQTFVIQVHICRYAGVVFVNEPECTVIDNNNHFGKMSFENWLSIFLNSVITAEGTSAYQERFVKKKRGTSTYYSVKETVEKFVIEIKSGSAGQLKLHPFHAVEWINHSTLNLFVQAMKKAFQESSWNSGIAYIERCWEVNLGLPSTKPDNVICDVLLCCPQMPLVLVSLTQSDIPDEASRLYNKRLAARLKATLVQEADCLEKFYVKPVVVSHGHLLAEDTTWICSENLRYPEAYRMNNNTYSTILEALVLVLARANVMSSHIVGQGLFNLLTYEQYKILHDHYEESPKVKITGPPGSGKTVLALERIHRLRNQGYTNDEVLFLCSNKPLKARVTNMKTRDKQPLCIVMTYYDVDNLVQSGRFDIELGTIKHILADETQNYQDNDSYLDSYLDSWWSELQRLCDDEEDSSFWVFLDVAQKIHKKRSVSLRKFSKKELKTIIRQTVNVHKFIADKYMNVDSQVEMGHDLEGPKVDVLVPSDSCPTHMHLLYILINQLHKLIVKDGHHKNDITVLFSDVKQKEFYQPLFVQRTSNSCPVRNGEEVKKHGVIFDSIRRYCGVDNNIVIGFCPEYYTSDFQSNNALMTTLCSRTKLKLILIFKNEQQARCFNLAPTELKHVKCGNIRKVVNFSRQ